MSSYAGKRRNGLRLSPEIREYYQQKSKESGRNTDELMIEALEIWMFVERMRELGHFLQLEDEGLNSEEWCANFGFEGIYSVNPCLAILKAGRAVEGK